MCACVCVCVCVVSHLGRALHCAAVCKFIEQYDTPKQLTFHPSRTGKVLLSCMSSMNCNFGLMP